MKNLWIRTSLLFGLIAMMSSVALGDEVVKIDYGKNWQGFMNVFEIDRTNTPPTAGASVFSTGWGFADLPAAFDTSANTLTMGPTPIPTDDGFWYGTTAGGGSGARVGNKFMDALGFVQETDTLGGMNVTFEGNVQTLSMDPNKHTAFAFIRDFAPDFSSFNESRVQLGTGAFTTTLATDAGAGRHVQYGINIQGENVWPGDAAGFGNIVFGAVPEPGSLVFLGMGTAGLMLRRRK